MSEDKQAIRERALRFRKELNTHPNQPEEAAHNFIQSVKPIAGQSVALYFPLGDELDTLSLAEKLWQMNIECLLPVFNKETREMKFARWEKDSKLTPGIFDIPMPTTTEFCTPDILAVPVVAFDQKGNRLGFGKGYYDATLNALRKERKILAVGYAYAEQAVLMKLPTEEHDEKLDMVVTPLRVFDFRD